MGIKVAIADDHALIREGITKIISLEPDLEVVWEADTGEKAVEMVIKKKPDVLLLDINMPGQGGVDTCRAIARLNPQVGIIVLTIHDQEDYLFELIKSGARAYLLKDISPDQLVLTIRGVARGESFVPPKLLNSLFMGINKMTEQAAKEINALTLREIEILKLLARGETNGNIARELYISEKTVKNHIYHIFQKLEVRDRTQAALYALKMKIVDL